MGKITEETKADLIRRQSDKLKELKEKLRKQDQYIRELERIVDDVIDEDGDPYGL